MSTGPKYVASKPVEANRARAAALAGLRAATETEYFEQLDANPAARNTELIERTVGGLTWWTYLK